MSSRPGSFIRWLDDQVADNLEAQAAAIDEERVMLRFRKRPVVVEAVQFLPDENPLTAWPDGVTPWDRGHTPPDMSWGYVVTIHGQQTHVHPGDWIVTEPDGGYHYPVKPDIFEATYEALDERSK